MNYIFDIAVGTGKVYRDQISRFNSTIKIIFQAKSNIDIKIKESKFFTVYTLIQAASMVQKHFFFI